MTPRMTQYLFATLTTLLLVVGIGLPVSSFIAPSIPDIPQGDWPVKTDVEQVQEQSSVPSDLETIFATKLQHRPPEKIDTESLKKDAELQKETEATVEVRIDPPPVTLVNIGSSPTSKIAVLRVNGTNDIRSVSVGDSAFNVRVDSINIDEKNVSVTYQGRTFQLSLLDPGQAEGK